jgi:hypothetical protein
MQVMFITFVFGVLFPSVTSAITTGDSVCEPLRAAASRRVSLDTARFYQLQKNFRTALEQADKGLRALSPAEQAVWKEALHWELMEQNSLPNQRYKLQELKTARRWLFSNTPGLEKPFFAPLRAAITPYIDAAESFSISDFPAAYQEHIGRAYQLCLEVQTTRTGKSARALGQELGWLKARGVCLSEVARVEKALSHSNVSLKVSKNFIERLFARQNKGEQVKQTSLNQTATLPLGFLGRDKQVQIRGSATTQGAVSLSLVPNSSSAEIKLSFSGYTRSVSTSGQGQVQSTSVTSGSVGADRSVFLTPQGMQFGDVVPWSRVQSVPQSITARSRLVERLAWRKVSSPLVNQATQAHANRSATTQISSTFEAEIANAMSESQAKLAKLQKAVEGFGEITVPFEREGSVPVFSGSSSTNNEIFLEANQIKGPQFGAPTRCQADFDVRKMGRSADVMGCVHESFINNTFETAWGGKWISDEYFMEMSKILQAELPMDLMVHSRTPRWRFHPRPLQPVIWNLEKKTDEIGISVHLDQLEYGSELYSGPITASTQYALQKDEFGAYLLARSGPVQLDWPSAPSAEVLEAIDRKFQALLAEKLDAKGIVIPDGGFTGVIAKVEPHFVSSTGGWLYFAVPVTDNLLDEAMALQSTPQP